MLSRLTCSAVVFLTVNFHKPFSDITCNPTKLLMIQYGRNKMSELLLQLAS